MIKARTKIGIADLIVCAVAVIVAVALLISPAMSTGNSVYVKTASDELFLDLSENCTKVLTSNGHTLTLEIKDGSVQIIDSDCPDGVCVATGSIDDPSKVIVCAPAKVLVRIQNGGGNADADVIAGR